MPRRKKLPKIPDYTGIPNSESKLVVQKSNPLQTLSETAMTLTELKILDAYLSKIDSHDEKKRYVRFEKGELERILGVSRILKDDLSKRLKNLFQVLTIKDKHKKHGFTMIALFEKAEAFQDEDGLWQVDLACTPSAMEYIFNIEVMGYLPYMLKNIIELTSRYSYILYLYLEQNSYRKSWTISINELKEMLRCTADTYKEYKRFNDLILKKCHKELNEKTTLRYSYEPVKQGGKGRKYTSVRFTVETVADKLSAADEPIAGQFTFTDQLAALDDQNEEQEIEYGGELANLLGSVACNDEFSPEQVRVLQDLVLQAAHTSDRLQMCDYLIRQMHKMNYYNPNPEKRFDYLCKMIQNDID